MSVQKSIETIIKKTPFLEEALKDKLINISALARILKDDVEKELGKPVKQGALMMAINRLSPSKILEIRRGIEKIAFNVNNFTMNSDLCQITFKNSTSILKSLSTFKYDTNKNKTFFTIIQGVFEMSFITSNHLTPIIESHFKSEEKIYKTNDLASITICLPLISEKTSGVYYLILKQFAWAGITVYEIISTSHEMTIFLKQEKIKDAVGLLVAMKKNN